MTPVQTRANGLVIPPLPQPLLTAALRMLAELALHVASTLWMCFRRRSVNATRPTPATLPEEKTDTQQQEANTVAASDSYPIALMVSSAAKAARPSNHELVLTGISQEQSGSGSKIRVPREGGDPVLLNKMSAKRAEPCSFKPGQASPPALDPRLRGGHGREIAPETAPA